MIKIIVMLVLFLYSSLAYAQSAEDKVKAYFQDLNYQVVWDYKLIKVHGQSALKKLLRSKGVINAGNPQALLLGEDIFIDIQGLSKKQIDYYVIHELVHYAQLKICGQAYMLKHIGYSEGLADKIAEDLSGYKFIVRNSIMHVGQLNSFKTYMEHIKKYGYEIVAGSCIQATETRTDTVLRYFGKNI